MLLIAHFFGTTLFNCLGIEKIRDYTKKTKLFPVFYNQLKIFFNS